jgi:tRNA 2-thiouridine synthesizing protein A
MTGRELDARGLLCPLPVIRTQDAIKRLAPGDVLHVVASDPGTMHDIPAWCRVHGHGVTAAADDAERLFRFRIAVEAPTHHDNTRR